MNEVSRPYRPGDEVQINRLYAMITGRVRTPDEYAWEWLHTWAGQGSIDLRFDLDREEGDQLIAQYSLIPTPLSVWGRPTVAGKTENCMSHPDHRGKGMYSRHEQEWFEKEKERYSFFFTTAGQVAGGAVGKVRLKLGYKAFDNWVNYTLWLHTGALRQELRAIIAGKGAVGRTLAPVLSVPVAAVVQAYSRCRRRGRCGYRVGVSQAGAEPLEQIEALWQANREHYGITVDRTARYLAWRIDKDPYLEHEYLTISDGDRLLGYAICFVQNDTLHVVDLLVDGKQAALFRHLLAAVVGRARERGVQRVKCLTLRRSPLLARHLESGGFIDKAVFSPGARRRGLRPRQFFLYIPDDLRDDPRMADQANWYITELVLEGLPRPPRSE